MFADWQHVIPIATDLQWRDSGFVAYDKARWRLHGGQHRALQGQRCLAGTLKLTDVLQGQTEVADEHGDQQPILRADPPRRAKLQPHGEVSCTGEHRDQSLCLSGIVRPINRLGRQRQLVTRILECMTQPRIESAPSRFGGLARHLDGRFALGRRPRHRDHALCVDRRPALLESDRQQLRHAFGHSYGSGQAQDRAFPGRKRPLRGDVTNGAHIHVLVGAASADCIDAHHHPCEVAVSMPNRCLVVGAAVAADPGLLIICSLYVHQPRVGPSVRQTIVGIAQYLDEGVVHLDDRALGIGYEKPLLQRIHQGGAEFVAVGKTFGAGSLFRVTLVAVEKPPGCDVERCERLHQEFQRDRRVVSEVLRKFED